MGLGVQHRVLGLSISPPSTLFPIIGYTAVGYWCSAIQSVGYLLLTVGVPPDPRRDAKGVSPAFCTVCYAYSRTSRLALRVYEFFPILGLPQRRVCVFPPWPLLAPPQLGCQALFRPTILLVAKSAEFYHRSHAVS
jgi:hypothetical protein